MDRSAGTGSTKIGYLALNRAGRLPEKRSKSAGTRVCRLRPKILWIFFQKVLHNRSPLHTFASALNEKRGASHRKGVEIVVEKVFKTFLAIHLPAPHKRLIFAFRLKRRRFKIESIFALKYRKTTGRLRFFAIRNKFIDKAGEEQRR